MEHQEYADYEVRGWALDYSIKANAKGVGADKIIKDAQKFYGFMFPVNGDVKSVSIKGGKVDKKQQIASKEHQPKKAPPKREIIRSGTNKERVYKLIVSLRGKREVARPFELAKALNVDKSIVNNAAKDLEQSGLIKRFYHSKRHLELLLPHEPEPEGRINPPKQNKLPGVRAKKLLADMIEMVKQGAVGKGGDFTRQDVVNFTGEKVPMPAMLALISSGYIIKITIEGGEYYRVVKNIDGSSYETPGVVVREDGVKVCPPRHCSGYGIGSRLFER